jgi:maltose-binding protein MalE
VYLSAASAHPDQARALLAYIGTEENIVALQQGLGTIPVRRDVLRNSALRSSDGLRAWYELVAAGVPLPNVPELDTIWEVWLQALEVAIPGLTPPEEAMQEAVDRSGLVPAEDAR